MPRCLPLIWVNQTAAKPYYNQTSGGRNHPGKEFLKIITTTPLW
jgi:hypothetical protein